MNANSLLDDSYKLGIWCGVPSSYSAELLCAAGFDWICIDGQHGMLDTHDVLTMLQAAAITDTPAIVRVPAPDAAAAMMKALDAGAAGILAPMVNNREQALLVSRACRYAPMGTRSWGPVRGKQSGGAGRTPAGANQAVICAAQIETPEACANLDEILGVPGIDLLLVGPSDLAVAMGLQPQFGPIPGPHADTIADIAVRCRKAGVAPAIYAGSAAAAVDYARLGYKILAVVSDTGILAQGARQELDTVRTGLDGG